MNKRLNIKGLTFICLFLGMALSAPAQGGYSALSKAEKLIEKGNYQRARVHLEVAREQDYGFCGNAWASAFNGIRSCEARILIAKEKYGMALDSLHQISYGFDETEPYDSLKVVCLLGMYGKEKAREYVDAAVERSIVMGWFEAEIEPPLQVRLPGRTVELAVGRFGGAYVYAQIKIDRADSKAEKGKHFWELVRLQPFYKLLEA